jgi:hypothetical protein
MTTAISEREEIFQIARTLPDEKVAAAVKFMRQLCVESDPFYSENNMKHLRAVKADVESGLNMCVHELILKVPNNETRAAMKEADEIVRSHRKRFHEGTDLFDDREKNSGE